MGRGAMLAPLRVQPELGSIIDEIGRWNKARTNASRKSESVLGLQDGRPIGSFVRRRRRGGIRRSPAEVAEKGAQHTQIIDLVANAARPARRHGTASVGDGEAKEFSGA